MSTDVAVDSDNTKTEDKPENTEVPRGGQIPANPHEIKDKSLESGSVFQREEKAKRGQNSNTEVSSTQDKTKEGENSEDNNGEETHIGGNETSKPQVGNTLRRETKPNTDKIDNSEELGSQGLVKNPENIREDPNPEDLRSTKEDGFHRNPVDQPLGNEGKTSQNSEVKPSDTLPEQDIKAIKPTSDLTQISSGEKEDIRKKAASQLVFTNLGGIHTVPDHSNKKEETSSHGTKETRTTSIQTDREPGLTVPEQDTKTTKLNCPVYSIRLVIIIVMTTGIT